MDKKADYELLELLALRDALDRVLKAAFSSTVESVRCYQVLSRLQGRESLTTAELSRTTLIPEASVKRTIDKLVKPGLVSRTLQREPGLDQRRTRVSVTESGLLALAEAVDAKEDLVSSLSLSALPRNSGIWERLKEVREELEDHEERASKQRQRPPTSRVSASQKP